MPGPALGTGAHAHPSPGRSEEDANQLIGRVLKEARELVNRELTELFARRRATGYGPLYELLADYPFREGKGLRPAICLAACRAVGGRAEQVRVSATALELFHNAFLVHDDIEDVSEFRRGRPTLFREHGVPVAINVGDATNVLAMGCLVDNLDLLGVRKSLLILQQVERMARESVEGQAIELSWIRDGIFDLQDRDYMRMAYKKTCWYTVIAPLRIGVICGSPPGPAAPLGEELDALLELGHYAGIAFQVCDDLLNLEAEEHVYGKEIAGDLWEGKRTIMLLHFLRKASRRDRARAVRILRTPRPKKKIGDVQWLLDSMHARGSIRHGHAISREFYERAMEVDGQRLGFFQNNADREFLRQMLGYVIHRLK